MRQAAGLPRASIRSTICTLWWMCSIKSATIHAPSSVRGSLAPWARDKAAADPTFRIRRRKLRKGGVDPSLLEVDRQWLMLDIDNWPLPSRADLADDPDIWVDAAIRELLPPAFHDAECWWQLSSSAGFVPEILKVHLFFWLTAPETNDHIRRS